MRTVTITDENSIIVDQFVVSNSDARLLASDYETSWMDDDEMREYLKDGE